MKYLYGYVNLKELRQRLWGAPISSASRTVEMGDAEDTGEGLEGPLEGPLVML